MRYVGTYVVHLYFMIYFGIYFADIFVCYGPLDKGCCKKLEHIPCKLQYAVISI